MRTIVLIVLLSTSLDAQRVYDEDRILINDVNTKGFYQNNKTQSIISFSIGTLIYTSTESYTIAGETNVSIYRDYGAQSDSTVSALITSVNDSVMIGGIILRWRLKK